MLKIHAAMMSLLLAACATAPREFTPPPASPPAIGSAPTAPAPSYTESLSSSHRATPLTWAALAAMQWPAPQTRFHGYRSTVRNAAWTNVYVDGATELYCRTRITRADAARRRVGTLVLSLEHSYPAIAAAHYFGFTDRDCRAPQRPPAQTSGCLAATGDLHNLWPAFERINSSHGDSPYGELEGEDTDNTKFKDFCPDYERGQAPMHDIVEPTEAARGDLARSILYMHYVYGLPFQGAVEDKDMLIAWANDDPPDDEETAREAAIERQEPNSWNPLVPRPPTS